jgi:hypothetical protein
LSALAKAGLVATAGGMAVAMASRRATIALCIQNSEQSWRIESVVIDFDSKEK